MVRHPSLRAFTLIELLVVIAIIALLSSVVLASLNTARAKARDAERRSDLEQLSTALELKYSDTGSYPASAGWLNNPNHGGLDSALTPTYIPSIPDDPTTSSTAVDYLYWREDYNMGLYCAGVAGRGIDHYDLYAHLENPSAADLAAFTTPVDQCVKNTWNMNFKKGN